MIRANVPDPLLVGPDEEGAQWVAEIAGLADAPHVILVKERSGDRQVHLTLPDMHS